MSCPQIYLGTGRFSPVPPLSPEYANDSIQPPSYFLTSGVPITVPVTVYNHGTDGAPRTLLELFYADPSTGFIPVGTVGTHTFLLNDIPGGLTLPPSEGSVPFSFVWMPTTVGHFCLLARLSNLDAPAGACLSQTYGSDPAIDPLSGIHNVQIIAPPPPPKAAPHRPRSMWFAFAASNTLRDQEDTKLTVQVLDPMKDRAKLEALVSQPGIDRILSRRRLRFSVPNGVHVAEGRERVIVPQAALHPKPESRICIPRIGRLGQLAAEVAPHLILPGSRLMDAAHGTIDMRLLPGEQRQTLVQVEPGDHDHAVYAVEVSHSGADGRVIGGLVLLFVPPHNYF